MVNPYEFIRMYTRGSPKLTWKVTLLWSGYHWFKSQALPRGIFWFTVCS